MQPSGHQYLPYCIARQKHSSVSNNEISKDLKLHDMRELMVKIQKLEVVVHRHEWPCVWSCI